MSRTVEVLDLNTKLVSVLGVSASIPNVVPLDVLGLRMPLVIELNASEAEIAALMYLRLKLNIPA